MRDVRVADVRVGERAREDLGDLRSLAASIERIGLLHPIVVRPDLTLVVGQRRLEAFRLLGRETIPATVATSFEEVMEAYLAEDHENEERLDFSPTEKVRAARKIESEERQSAKERQREAGRLVGLGQQASAKLAEASGATRDQVAAAVGTSHGTLAKATAVVEAAEADPERFGPLVERMRTTRKVDGAYRELKHREAKAEVAKQQGQKPLQAMIVQADAEEWLQEAPDCDLLLTDPPYSTEMDEDEFSAFVECWLPAALAKVKPTGRGYVFIGAYPKEFEVYLRVANDPDSPMPCLQVLVWSYRNTIGPTPSMRYKQNWQAILYFEGENAEPLNCPILTEQFSAQEVNAPDARQFERVHKWQKPDELAQRYVRHATEPGHIVLDPFAGSGTFLLAAARLGRIGIGCDNDEAAVKIAVERGCERG